MNRIHLFDDEYCNKERDRFYSTTVADYIIKRKSALQYVRKTKTRKELLDWLNIKDPFGDYEILENWSFDPKKSIIKQLESIIEYFSQLQSVQNYIKDYEDGNIEWVGGGASRRVY